MRQYFAVLFALVLTLSACRDKQDDPVDTNPPAPVAPDIQNTFGYGVLGRLKGIWNGPVTSTTALGSFPEWIVDFRPVSASQISAKNELDSINDIHLSFFITLHNNQYKVAMRNGGGFAGNQRNSYFLADSVSENSGQAYYRFSEVVQGRARAYSELIFRADSLYLRSYTNVYNTQPSATPHMSWSAKLQDTTSCAAAVAQFGFPQKQLTIDFSHAFDAVLESIYYNSSSEPYPASAQPYLGQSQISYSYASQYTPNPSSPVFLIITTQPLFSGFTFNAANLKYRSRYVMLPAADPAFTFTGMHPGGYYLYAFYDADGNNMANSGDWISAVNTPFTLSASGTVSASTQINFTIP